jgi:hypothetical protein
MNMNVCERRDCPADLVTINMNLRICAMQRIATVPENQSWIDEFDCCQIV